jgi:hypothetical protein
MTLVAGRQVPDPTLERAVERVLIIEIEPIDTTPLALFIPH